MQLSAPRRSGLLTAALALPGLAASLAPVPASADAPPAREISLRAGQYRDFQPGANRIRVNTPSLFVVLPIGEDWSARAAWTMDAISGASPLFYNTLSGASGLGVTDIRRAADVELTRHFEHGSVAVGVAYSDENDYDSRALRLKGTRESDDHNTTFSFGVGYSDDAIDSVNDIAQGERKRVLDLQAGVTRVLSPVSLAAISMTWALGDGYYDDPYKPLDSRPDARNQAALMLRYNRYFQALSSALRLSYRYYGDSWEIRAHTAEAAWEYAFAQGWSITPSLRHHSQSQARFYFDPPFGSGLESGRPYSADTRLSAFGAWTLATQLTAPLGAGWQLDLKAAFYRQRSEWRWFGDGSDGIEPLSARLYEVGLRKRF